MTDWIYDFEVLPNVFTCKAQNHTTKKIYKFEISPRMNERVRFIKWINMMKIKGDRMVAYNSIHYDYPMLHYFLTTLVDDTNAKRVTKCMYDKSKAIFRDSKWPATKFKHTIWDHEHLIQQIDLFKVHHFDNMARSTSLKRLQFNMRLRDIKEFEIAFDKPLRNSKQIDSLLTYNEYDVTSTGQFYDYSKSNVDFREDMSQRMGKSYMNYNDTKIGEEYMLSKIVEHTDKDFLYYWDDYGNRKKKITERTVMPIKDLIFDYIKFETPEFQAILDKMNSLKMFVIKGKFHWNEHANYPIMLKAIGELKTELKALPKELKQPLKDEIKELTTKYANHHISCEMDGLTFEFGKGGLHATLRNAVEYTTENEIIVDIDATSYYPKIGIENGLYPKHLGKIFCQIYSDVFEMRQQHEKGTTENAMLKLALNGTYGKTNSKYSSFCDPKYTVQTTLNGQLMLCMLWEQLRKIKGTRLIQVNTDGITIKFKKNKATKRRVKKVCRDWEKLTRIPLEYAVYMRMWIRDGNNYIAEYKGGKLKQKGAYLYRSLFHSHDCDPSGIEWHKNHSMMIVQKAVEAELVDHISAHKFIQEHKNIYDFFLCTNVNRACELWLGDGIIPKKVIRGKTIPAEIGLLNESIQRVSRYIVSKSNDVLTKQMKPLKGKTDVRFIGINVNYNVSVYNTVESDNAQDYDINYDFYIAEAEKLLKPFRGK